MKEQHTKHVTYKIAYHFVWCPNYRKAILQGEVATFVESEIRRLCADNNWQIRALHVQEDHVHLFVSTLPRVAPSLVANTLKGITARQVFKQYPEVKQQLWGGSFWARSYLVVTTGEIDNNVIRSFLEKGQ